MATAGVKIAEFNTLKALTFRLSSTSTLQLPQQIPAIAASLVNCKSLLSSEQSSTSKSSPEVSVLVHKYRTLLSTLLQDRTVHGRWAAIVLIKATIEVGGREILEKSLPWVRGLLGILTKPDPSSMKKLCLITLTRIFGLTREHPTLARDIATPSLPTYVQSCLHIASSNPSSDLLQAVIESFGQLLPRHPTIFRAYQKQLQQLLGPLIAPTPSNKLGREQLQGFKATVPLDVAAAAHHLYVQLPCCAPKGGSSDEWEKAIKGAVVNAHRIADKVFRAVVEDWQSSQGLTSSANGATLDDEVRELGIDSMGLPPWAGIFAGGERLVSLIRLVKQYLTTPTSNTVSLPLGLILDLLTRMMSLTVPLPSSPSSSPNGVRVNHQVSKEERENLWTFLPQVHLTSMELLIALSRRYDGSAFVLDSSILDQLVWVFNAEKSNVHVRTAYYHAVAELLKRSGLALSKSSIDTLSSTIRSCCDDILPQGKENGAGQQQINADSFLKTSIEVANPVAAYGGLQQAANDLLPVLASRLPAQYLSDSLRTRMDRTAILTRHKDAMIASVLHPPPSKRFGKPTASILPLLARSFVGAQEVESLLRPRMPVLRTGVGASDIEDDAEEVDMEVENNGYDHFMGEELDALLETAAQTEAKESGNGSTGGPSNEDTINQTTVPSSDGQTAVAAEIQMNEIITRDMEASVSNKRSQIDEGHLSPPKRVKMKTRNFSPAPEPASQPATESTAVTFTSSVVSHAPVALPVQADIGTSINYPGIVPEDISEDDDDFGELVIGQDTDEELE
jgi:pre-rRNA-processing protein RIX1